MRAATRREPTTEEDWLIDLLALFGECLVSGSTERRGLPDGDQALSSNRDLVVLALQLGAEISALLHVVRFQLTAFLHHRVVLPCHI